MSQNVKTAVQKRTALPSLVLFVSAIAFLLVSVTLVSAARAEDPPVVSVPPVGAGGNTASGEVGSNGKTNACVNDQGSEADPSSPDKSNAAKVNEGSCKSTSSGSKESQTGSGSRSSARTGSRSTRSSARATISAAGAVGLRIVRVRHLTKGVTVTKRFRVLVTLRDGRGKLVRDAIVTIGKVPGARNTISGKFPTFSNRLGQAAVRVPVAKRLLGKRLFLKISARTPKARTITLRSVRLPALGQRSAPKQSPLPGPARR